MRISATPEAGRVAGHSLKATKPNQLKQIDSYSEALSYLDSIKSEILKLKNESRNYFKFAPGSQASGWERFYNEKIIAIDFEDLTRFTSREELNQSIGLPEDNISNKTWNLWLLKTANIGDVVFDFREMKSDYSSKVEKLEAKLIGLSHSDINIKDLLDKEIDILLKLDYIYETADIEKKQEVISSMFPEKLYFENSSLRTGRINTTCSLISQHSFIGRVQVCR